MRTAIKQQILSTLGNLRQEVESNGMTEAASDMWIHALSMHRKARIEESSHGDTVIRHAQADE